MLRPHVRQNQFRYAGANALDQSLHMTTVKLQRSILQEPHTT